MNWKELSIDNTFNLTPKLSPREGTEINFDEKLNNNNNMY